MNQANSNQALIILVACVLISAIVSLAAVLVAVQRPLVVVVQPGQSTVATAATVAQVPAAASPASAAAPPAPAPAPAPVAVTSVRLATLPGHDDPFDPAWNAVPVAELQLLPQQVASPMLDAASVRTLRVQSARDDRRIAWRVVWDAPQPSASVETGVFPDAVAVQFPLADGAPFTMGAKGKPVCVLHWKALWQKDADEGFQDVHDLYPNARSDLYWFAKGSWPYPVDEAFDDERSRQWLVGQAAGNPMSQVDRAQPIEELIAEGFGSTTTVPDTPSAARGRWRDGQWTIVIDRPLSDADPLSVCLQPQKPSQVAFAVWDGHADNVGARKHYVGWVPFKVEP